MKPISQPNLVLQTPRICDLPGATGEAILEMGVQMPGHLNHGLAKDQQRPRGIALGASPSRDR